MCADVSASIFLLTSPLSRRLSGPLTRGRGDRIVEIGPGKGALTIPLLSSTGQLDVIEVDRDLAAVLVDRCRDIGRLNLLRQDALKTDFAAFAADRLTVVGNLPYNISTPLLFRLLRFDHISVMLFMLQKEVVDRLCASPDTPEYGRLSVMVQARCRADKLFDVGAGAFRPRPKVDSALVRLDVLPGGTGSIRNFDLFTDLVRTAFSSRRKKISNGLKPWFTAAQLEQLNISPSARPAELSVPDYINLSNSLN